MKKIIVCLLVFSIILSLVACSTQTKFDKFQGTWVYKEDIYEKHIRIEGDYIYQGITSKAADNEWALGYGIIKENGKFYVNFSDSKQEISVSDDGTKLYYQGETYYKE